MRVFTDQADPRGRRDTVAEDASGIRSGPTRGACDTCLRSCPTAAGHETLSHAAPAACVCYAGALQEEIADERTD
jgi:hypothetical protein